MHAYLQTVIHENGNTPSTDQGSEFNNKLNQKLMSELQIDHRLTTAYHPQVRS